MTLKNAVMTVAIAAAVLFGGCRDVDFPVKDEAVRSVGTYAVVVGMENSGLAGACPGAMYDAKRMYNLLSRYAGSAVLLVDNDATYGRVRAEMEKAAAEAELFILYYSGHGGSGRFSDTGSEEEDGQDEYLCLYDTYMRDNDIWSVVAKCHGRVLLVFDCCHSKTMFSVPSVTMARGARAMRSARGSAVRMQCWSGCPDDTVSYGSTLGGELTNTILKYFTGDITYDDLWHRVDNDAHLKRFEDAQRTVIGEPFGTERMFR